MRTLLATLALIISTHAHADTLWGSVRSECAHTPCTKAFEACLIRQAGEKQDGEYWIYWDDIVACDKKHPGSPLSNLVEPNK